MITEDYVSFEIAKLLKEKGFDYYPDGSYWLIDANNVMYWVSEIGAYDYVDVPTESFQRPKNGYRLVTLQMVMKWLREVHKIVIMIQPLSFNGAKDCLCDNWTYSVWVGYNLKIGESLGNQNGYYSTYEEACEAAIKFGMFFVDNKTESNDNNY